MNFSQPAPNRLFTRSLILLPMAAAMVLPLSSCNALSGAVIGGAVGAGLGQAAGGDTESTLVGAAIGASIGALYGYNVEKKREARLLASRQATEAELRAAQRETEAISAASREKAVARAEAYAAEHAEEHKAAAVDPVPQEKPMRDVVPSREEAEPAQAVVEETPVEETVAEEVQPEEPAQTIKAAYIPDDTLIGIVPLPSGEGVFFTNAKTGELLGNNVHQLDNIKDVSDASTPEMEEDDEPKPFTLILSDEETGKTRQYTAIYNA